MEINITAFFTEATPKFYSASCAEMGDSAGTIIWHNANLASMDWQMICTDEQKEAFRTYVKSFGAWDESEITSWSDQELNALFIQLISGDMREGGLCAGADWDEYQAASEAGQVSGRIFKADDGEVYYQIGD